MTPGAFIILVSSLVLSSRGDYWGSFGGWNATNAIYRETYHGQNCVSYVDTTIVGYFDWCRPLNKSGNAGSHATNNLSTDGRALQYTEYGMFDVICLNGTLLVIQLNASGFNWSAVPSWEGGNAQNLPEYLQCVYNVSTPFGVCVNDGNSYRLTAPGRFPVTPLSALQGGPGGGTAGAPAAAISLVMLFPVIVLAWR